MSRPQPMSSVLGSPDGALPRLLARAAALAALDKAVRARLDPPLADHCRVANLSAHTLVLQTDSPAWASQLRFLAPALLTRLKTLPPLADVRQIRVLVRPAAPAPASARRPASVSESAASSLRAAAQGLDGELAGALQRLAARLSR